MLIFTAMVSAGSIGVSHTETPYPSEQSCQAAYKIDQQQFSFVTNVIVNETCLKVQ
jgi:hypothetical protein